MSDSSQGRPLEMQPEGRSLGAIARNERGAMMIMGVFMATLIAGMLYYVAGIGETIVYRERMQDAADSGALAGAVFLARGMNLIVLLNITLASVFAVLVAAWTAFFVLLTAAGMAWSECSFPYGIANCIAGLCLTIAAFEGCGKISDAEDIVSDVASATHRMQSDAATIVPLAAAGTVFESTVEHYQPPVDFGIGTLGLVDSLPVEDDPSPPICERTTLPNSFALFSWIRTSMHGQELADDLGGNCNGSFLDNAKPMAFVWSIASCYIAASEVDDELMRVTDGVELGDPEFQFRTLMYGTPPYGTGDDDRHDKRVGVATVGHRDEAGSFWRGIQALSRVSFAQAEFYYDDETDRDDWMWEFKWRARLRRFRPSGSFCDGAGSDVCGAVSSGIVH